MSKVRVGIQGSLGSSNHRACQAFAQRGFFSSYEVVPLLSSENVLRSVDDGSIDYGIFAWRSSRKGVVEESQKASEKYEFKKIAQVELQMNHALLARCDLDLKLVDTVHVYSHPQALLEHKDYLEEKFRSLKCIADVDTALCAKQLAEGKYLANSLVIAPVSCAKLYGLSVFEDKLPLNEGYFTEFHLVKGV